MDNCYNCIFNMSDSPFHSVCAGRTDIYGMDIDEVVKLYPNGCDEWESDLMAPMDVLCKKGLIKEK